jgi:hypothetical protein
VLLHDDPDFGVSVEITLQRPSLPTYGADRLRRHRIYVGRNAAQQKCGTHEVARDQVTEDTFIPRHPHLGHNQTIGAIAHQLCRLIWKILHQEVPDGRAVLYTAAWDGNPGKTYSTRPEFPESRSLGNIRFHLLAVSQLGEMAVLLKPNLVAHRQHIGTLAVAPLSGGAPRELADGITDADWSPNGKELAVVRSSHGRYRLECPIGTVRYETSGWISDIRFSKDGDTIAFVDHDVFPDDGGAIALLDLNGHKSVLSKGWNSIEGLAWSADGNEVWFGAGALQAVTRGGTTRAVLRAGTDITLHDISHTVRCSYPKTIRR